jgi:hypothetical protein
VARIQVEEPIEEPIYVRPAELPVTALFHGQPFAREVNHVAEFESLSLA